MTKKINELSLFFPAYNLEAQIETTVKKAYQVVPKLVDNYEVIVVNDGSRDKTGRILSDLCLKYPNLRVITHEVNRGYGAALKSGFYSAKYAWIAFADADGQFDIEELPRLIKKQQETGADLIAGYYIKRAVGFSRKINTWLWQFVVRTIFSLKVRDIDCGFKLISKRVINSIQRLESERGAFISSELLIKAQKRGFKIVEIGVHHFPREEGATGAKLNVIVKSFFDLFKLWWKLR
jgi:glycosyltransferase involved in cell wall biosynthesis